MVIPVYQPTDWIDAAIHAAKNPLGPILERAGTRARMAEIASTSGRPAPQQPAPDPEPQAPPPAGAPALFSGAYAGAIYAKRLRVVRALQAEAEAEPSPPPAAPMFSVAYGDEIFAARAARVRALQAEAEAAAVALAERLARGRS
jgi:hypothetical protein